jgi:SPP1 gp7 family putative phage head morphogenesis protein
MKVDPRILTSDPRWRQDALADDLADLVDTLRARFRGVWPESRIQAAVADIYDRVNGQNARQFNAQWSKAIPSVDPLPDPELKAAFVRENVRLIKSIDARYFDEIERLVLDAVANGTRVETLRNDIRGRYGVSRSRAALIARDQVGKVVGQMTRKRQVDAGVEQATWSTSLDERVRRTHREAEGKTFDLNGEGLLVGGKHLFPGQDYQCRCSSIPVVPGFI